MSIVWKQCPVNVNSRPMPTKLNKINIRMIFYQNIYFRLFYNNIFYIGEVLIFFIILLIIGTRVHKMSMASICNDQACS